MMNPWPKLMTDATLLWIDSCAVMTLRAMRLAAGGPAAAREAQRMTGEKAEAAFEFAGAIAGGRVRTPAAATRKAISVTGRRVRANRRRLS